MRTYPPVVLPCTTVELVAAVREALAAAPEARSLIREMAEAGEGLPEFARLGADNPWPAVLREVE